MGKKYSFKSRSYMCKLEGIKKDFRFAKEFGFPKWVAHFISGNYVYLDPYNYSDVDSVYSIHILQLDDRFGPDWTLFEPSARVSTKRFAELIESFEKSGRLE